MPNQATSLDYLKKIKYLDLSAIGSRTVSLFPFWNGESWETWHPSSNGLIQMKPLEILDADYIAKEPVKQSDLWIPFIDFMWQHASWVEVCPFIDAVRNDFRNLATSVAKIRHFFKLRESFGTGIASAFVTTELEYILVLVISIFDLLQEMIAAIWGNRIILIDKTAELRRKGRSLPKTFSKMVLREKRDLKTKVEIENEYGLPISLAEAYAKNAQFFSTLRDARNKIIHRGSSIPLIFVTDKGFCVDPKESFFRAYKGWKPEHYQNNNIASLLPWLSHVIFHTIESCNDFMVAFATQVKFPPEIAPGYRIFVRGYNNEALIDIMNFLRGGSPWWQELTPSVVNQEPEKMT